ncbi:MAG: flagellar motor protein MotB [Planctomycetota bacterium]
MVRRLSCVLFLALVPALCSCVPLIKYQDLEKRLSQAEEINRNLMLGLRNAEQSGSESTSGAALIGARYKEMESKYDALVLENEATRAANERLRKQLEDIPNLPLPDSGFSQQAASEMGFDRTASGALLLSDALFFQSGRSVLREGPRKELDSLASKLLNEYAGKRIHIEGHSDNTKVVKSNNADNWDLSAKRAHSVFKYLVDKGVPEDRFVLHGYGYSRPADGVTDPNTKENQAKCRRVEIRLGN